MKRITVLLLSVMLVVITYGQSNGEKNKELFALVKVFSQKSKKTATIDFGDGTPRLYFADEKGKTKNFESDFEPINMLIKKGWEIEKFSSFWDNYNTVTLWIMKKKVNGESEAKEGIKLVNE